MEGLGMGRLDKYASVIVSYSVQVEAGDKVVIKGTSTGLPLIRAIYKKVLRAGGHPVLILEDEGCDDLLFAHGNENQISYRNPIYLKEIEMADKWIEVWADDNLKRRGKVDHKKIAMELRAQQPESELWNKRICAIGKPEHLPWVGAAFPCVAAAQNAGMSLEQYENFVYQAGFIDCDYPIAEWGRQLLFQQSLAAKLNSFRKLRFTTRMGTDISFVVPQERHWWTCAGKENFPDGEIYTTPLEDSANGIIRFGFPIIYNGVEVCDVILVFKNGKVVGATASKNKSYLESILNIDGAKRIGELAFGLNPRITEFTSEILFDEKIGGTFHIALGDAYSNTGGTNKLVIHWDMICDLRDPGSKVYGDGSLIQEEGKWLIS